MLDRRGLALYADFLSSPATRPSGGTGRPGCPPRITEPLPLENRTRIGDVARSNIPNPACKRCAPSRGVPLRFPREGSRGSPFVVGDDPAIGGLVRTILGDDGYRASLARILREGYPLLRGLPLRPDPGQHGGATCADRRAALKAVKAAGATPVVIFSARPPHNFANYAERGFVGLLSKPFDLDEL